MAPRRSKMGRINQDKTILMKAFLILALVSVENWSADAAEPPPRSLALPGCLDTCGNVTNIPYPFGIGPGCFLGPRFEIDCQQDGGISTPLLKYFDVVVLDIRLPQNLESPGHIRVRQPISYSPNCMTYQQNDRPVSLREGYWIFRYSHPGNYFVAGGSDVQALMYINHSKDRFIGCNSICGRNWTFVPHQCVHDGGCCTIEITDLTVEYSVEFKALNGEELGDAECAYAFVVDTAWWMNADLNSLLTHVPVSLEWAITQSEEEQLSSNRHRNDHSGSCWMISGSLTSSCQQIDGTLTLSCQTDPDAARMSCVCNQGYEGNYFLPQGCQGEIRTSLFTSYLKLVLYPKPRRTI